MSMGCLPTARSSFCLAETRRARCTSMILTPWQKPDGHGIATAVLSGEETPAVHRVAQRFGISEVILGAKDKLAGLRELTTGWGSQWRRPAMSETPIVTDQRSKLQVSASLPLMPLLQHGRRRITYSLPEAGTV